MFVNVEMPCERNYELALPNTFSPNGDGNNDKYCLQGWDLCVTNFDIIIYDRWGEKVFESIDPSFCWDGTYNGKALEPAVFIYVVKALFNNSVNLNKKGNVTLIK
jgi:gliding motility-associated-like protein